MSESFNVVWSMPHVPDITCHWSRNPLLKSEIQKSKIGRCVPSGGSITHNKSKIQNPRSKIDRPSRLCFPDAPSGATKLILKVVAKHF